MSCSTLPRSFPRVDPATPSATARVDSFVWRHPLVCLGLLIYVVGFVYDAIQEISWCGPGCTFTPRSFPLARSLPAIRTSFRCFGNLPSLPPRCHDPCRRAAVPGRHGAHRCREAGPAHQDPASCFSGTSGSRHLRCDVPHRQRRLSLPLRRWLCRRPGEREATSVACPFPYPEAKVYDPQGLYEKAGQPGPTRRASGTVGKRVSRAGPSSPAGKRRTLQAVVGLLRSFRD